MITTLWWLLRSPNIVLHAIHLACRPVEAPAICGAVAFSLVSGIT